MKNEINLLHTKTKSPLSSLANKVEILRTIAVFLLFLVSLLSVTFFFLVLVSPLPSLRKEENAKKVALRSLYGKITDLYIVNDRVKGVSDVLSKRVDFDMILGELLDRFPADISITTIKTLDKQLLFEVSSTSLTSLQNYIDTLVKENESKKFFSAINQSDLFLGSNSEKAKVTIIFTL